MNRQISNRFQTLVPRSFRTYLCVLTFVLATIGAGATHAFQLMTLDEQRVNLMEYVNQDRWTLVMFWATDCIPCEEQKPAFEAFHQRHQNELASVVGVAVDGVENKVLIDELIELHQPTYPNLMAFSDVYQRQFQELVGKPFRITPRYLVFSPDGKLYADSFGKMDFEALASHISGLN